MTQPKVTLNELDGQLGITPPSTGELMAIIGVSTTGTVGAPGTYGKVKDVQNAFGAGPLVEAAAYAIANYGNPVLLIKATTGVPGSSGTINVSGVVGTSVVTTSVGVATDAFSVILLVTNGGTIGVNGIKLAYSLDNGVNFSLPVSLGVATSFSPAGSGLTFAFAAGTLLVNDKVTLQTNAPTFDSSGLSVALTALGNSAVVWGGLLVEGTIDATTIAVLDSAFSGYGAKAKWRYFVANTRPPLIAGESEATYLSALTTIFSASSSTWGTLCAGTVKAISGVSGRAYKKPVSFVVGPMSLSVTHGIDIADVNLGTIPGALLTDSAGNTTEHNESLNPGLDDARFTVLRTWDVIQGTYVNRPRIFSPDGSDFQLIPHRRVMNKAETALYAYLIRRLNQPVRVNATTGFILESEALEIEGGANAILAGELLANPDASAARFVLSRTDNILSNKTLTGDCRVIPLGYVEFITVNIAFQNPALNAVLS